MGDVSRLESLVETLQSSLREAEHCNQALRNELSYWEMTAAQLEQPLEELQQQSDTVVSDPIAS